MALVADSVNHLFALPPHPPSRSRSRAHQPHSGSNSASPARPSGDSSAQHTSLADSASMSAHVDSHQSYQASAQDGVVAAADSDHPSPSKGVKRTIDATKSTDAMSSMADSATHHSTPFSSAQSPESRLPTVSTASQRILIRDLAHIQELAAQGGLVSQSTAPGAQRDPSIQYEISSMPIENIIEMVAGLLTKITTTNDRQHEHLHRQMPSPENPGPISAQTSSVLSFHGKNVPSITIFSYLNRINKYCPTSYEVFISLLVYFDRMTEKVNAGPIQSLREHSMHRSQSFELRGPADVATGGDGAKAAEETSQTATPPASGGLETPEPRTVPGTPHSRYQDSPHYPTSTDADINLAHFFVVDSFNIHRLVIAAVTCASKFFSDIFYTNSRYAKVGGLPLAELNHLELQFLLLNDFRLSVPVEELEAYGTMLVEFYAREVADQQTRS